MFESLNRLKSLFVFWAVVFLFAPMARADIGGSETYYAALKVNVANSGGGRVYASDSGTENANSYVTTESTGSKSTGTSGGNVTLYAYAKANDGYKFRGWAESAGPTDTFKSTNVRWEQSLAASTEAATSDDNPNAAVHGPYYAHFMKLEARNLHLYKPQTFVLTEPIDHVVSATSSNTAVVNVVQSGNQVTLSAVGAGTTTVVVTTAEFDSTPAKEYTYTVTVEDLRFSKTIHLARGSGDSATSCMETFARIDSVGSPSAANVVDVSQSGTSITFTALGEGEATVAIVAETESGKPATFVYTVKVEACDGEVEQVGDGYVTYAGTSDVLWDGDDLVLVYSDATQVGTFSIPAPYTATIDMLVVGGGGAGGSQPRFGQGGGGGGAGGFVLRENQLFTAGTFLVNVGAGAKVEFEEGVRMAMPGATGESSAITDTHGYSYVSANGGGGGGAAVAGGDGQRGGSGGGAAWYNRVAGKGGTGMDGQGNRGGKPTEYNCGGGGGGAGGVGGADCSGGAGQTSSITGETVLYAQGGRGGRADVTATAQAGNGPGFGGEGGNGGLGGNGADGIVVVRISNVSQNIKVPKPTTNDILRTRYQWENGSTFTGLDYAGATFVSPTDGQTYYWSDVISYVDGTTSVKCSKNGDEKVGIGYYNFAINLNDGFAWDDGEDDSYGSMDAFSHRWTIVENLEDVDATIEVSKSVTWTEGNQATVSINSFSSPEISGNGELNVLFLGSLCSAHGFSSTILNTALNTIASVANVDYYCFNDVTAASGVTADFSGSLRQGQTMTKTATLASGNHASLYGFYTALANVIDSGKHYDYIVFSFDRTLTATELPGTHAREAEIADYLAQFYDANAVVWLVDNRPSNDTGHSITQTPWFPSQLLCVTVTQQGRTTQTWSSLYYYEYQYVQENNRKNVENAINSSYSQLNALMGVFDPAHYPVDQTIYRDNYISKPDNVTAARVNATAGSVNENQVVYDDAENVATLLQRVIKPKPYDLSFSDKIVDPSEGLEVKRVTLKVCTTEVNGVASTNPTDWHELVKWDRATETVTKLANMLAETGISDAEMSVDMSNNRVQAVFKQVDFPVWAKLDIGVEDTGKFRTSENATYNPITGLWEKNPNDGKARVEMVNDEGVAMGVDGAADTAVPWKFEAFKVTGLAENGYIYVNGTQSNEISFYEGATAVVSYRGWGGFKIKSVEVDDEPVDLTPATTNGVTISEIAANHRVKVIYEPYVGDVISSPVTNAYDGVAHLFPVELVDWDTDYDLEVRYALAESDDDADYLTEEEFLSTYKLDAKNVGDYTFYYRIYAKQPGWGETLEDDGWVFTGVAGYDNSVITPQELYVTPNHAGPIPFGTEFTDPGYRITGAIPGETADDIDPEHTWHVVPDSYTPGVDGEGQYPTHMVGPVDKQLWGNYIVVVRPGVLDVVKRSMTIDDVPQGPNLDPEDPYTDTGVDRVTKVYDGTPSQLVVNVTMPNEHDQYVIHWRVGDDGPWLDEEPSFTDAGTNKVWYAVDPVGTAVEGYFSATNYSYVTILPRPITVKADDATKPYDGTALTCSTYQIVGDGPATGDAITAAAITGSRTAVGSSENALTEITIKNSSNVDVTKNYAVTLVDGTLTVTIGHLEIGGVEQPTDPSMPLDQGESGVDSVDVFYSGTGTNIVVTVTKPGDDSLYTIYYNVKSVDDPAYASSWTTERPLLTNVCDLVVHYVVESAGYAPVTNFAQVVIRPLEVTVTADNKEGVVGIAPPPYTAIVTGLLESEKDRVDELIYYSLTCPTFEDAVGTYPIIAGGEENQGNYHVTYIPGTLTMVERQRVVSLWIVDHADAGADRVHLAFKPTLNAGTLSAEFLKELETAGAIKVKCAATEKALESAPLKPIVSLRDGTGTQHLDRGWIWITVKVPDDATDNGPERLWKIVVQLPD